MKQRTIEAVLNSITLPANAPHYQSNRFCGYIKFFCERPCFPTMHSKVTKLMNLGPIEFRHAVTLSARKYAVRVRFKSALFYRIQNVIAVTSKKQMDWPKAGRIVAMVANENSARNWTYGQLISKAVSADSLSLELHASIAIASPSPIPDEARVLTPMLSWVIAQRAQLSFQMAVVSIRDEALPGAVLATLSAIFQTAILTYAIMDCMHGSALQWRTCNGPEQCCRTAWGHFYFIPSARYEQ